VGLYKDAVDATVDLLFKVERHKAFHDFNSKVVDRPHAEVDLRDVLIEIGRNSKAGDEPGANTNCSVVR
jgi:hypothetical protein